MPQYRLNAPYFSSKGLKERGEVLEFEEGTAPRGSVLVQADDPAPELEKKKEEPTTLSALSKAQKTPPALT